VRRVKWRDSYRAKLVRPMNKNNISNNCSDDQVEREGPSESRFNIE